jgi:carboxymethylenebutenolidase
MGSDIDRLPVKGGSMWNTFSTDVERFMTAGVLRMTGGGGDEIHAYIARPDGEGPYPGVVMVHHAPGWDEFYREFARRFAEHGYIAIVPDLYERYGHGTPDDVAARVRGNGGIADDSVVADAEAAMQWVKAQPSSNGKVGIIGTCSGGRHAVLTASRVDGFGAVADLWGGGVVASPNQLNEKRPVAPIDLTPNLNAPIIGLFGNDDRSPSPEQVNQHEAVLKEQGKTYMFHRYDGAGHGFFYYHSPSYRQQQAMDGWNKVLEFFNQHLG